MPIPTSNDDNVWATVLDELAEPVVRTDDQVGPLAGGRGGARRVGKWNWK